MVSLAYKESMSPVPTNSLAVKTQAMSSPTYYGWWHHAKESVPNLLSASTSLPSPPLSDFGEHAREHTACMEATGSTLVSDSSAMMYLPVRNTFVHFSVDRPPSLEGFFEERKVKSAPASGCWTEALLESTAQPMPISISIADALQEGRRDGNMDLREEAQLGSDEIPTLGSQGHHVGRCRPCAFVWKDEGCLAGIECQFCHLCDSGEKKRRAKEKRHMVKLRHAIAKGLNLPASFLS